MVIYRGGRSFTEVIVVIYRGGRSFYGGSYDALQGQKGLF